MIICVNNDLEVLQTSNEASESKGIFNYMLYSFNVKCLYSILNLKYNPYAIVYGKYSCHLINTHFHQPFQLRVRSDQRLFKYWCSIKIIISASFIHSTPLYLIRLVLKFTHTHTHTHTHTQIPK